MKITNKTDRFFSKKPKKVPRGNKGITRDYSIIPKTELYKMLESFPDGLTENKNTGLAGKYGKNIITKGKKESLFKRIFKNFINLFSMILIFLAVFSSFTEIIWVPSNEKNPITVIIISIMILVSGFLRLFQESKSGKAAEKLQDLVTTTCTVERSGKKKEIPMEELLPGDIVYLSAGDMIPADIRILSAKDLFITQSAITGESSPVEKSGKITYEKNETDKCNLAFMESSVVSGTGKAIVLRTGNDTLLGKIAEKLVQKVPETSFEKGVNSVSWILIKYMIVMVPCVLILNGLTDGDWLSATLFAISIAIGLTPEMLPMIVTTCLSKGAVSMSYKKVIIKNLNAIQNLGTMDILCSDKTGTLTEDQVALEVHLNVKGEEDEKILEYGFLNSYYQTGLSNLMDKAIINKTFEVIEKKTELKTLKNNYEKIDEIPFDFTRRRMSVVLRNNNTILLITKGALEEMLSISDYCEFEGKIIPINEDLKNMIIKKNRELNEKGLRVLGIAWKNADSQINSSLNENLFKTEDEKNMVFAGFLGFLDPPKKNAAKAIKALREKGIKVKIITGDNEVVTKSICNSVGIPCEKILTGELIDRMNIEELKDAVEDVNVFAKVNPNQKAMIVKALQDKCHTVGYMGDGINDGPSLKIADVGISVDTAVDIAKEASHVVMLEKDLMVLKDGFLEGRKTYGNMVKYIKMTLSSNFGNMFSVLIASIFLPFLPMESKHLILLNLVYDISCTALPWDNVDEEFTEKQKKWDGKSISRFMLWFGPVSSLFDITTYLTMYFVICPMIAGGSYSLISPENKLIFIAAFQTGWFIESMWTQSLVIHMIRTKKIPFIQSRASKIVTIFSFSGIGFLTIIPFTAIGKGIGLLPPPFSFFIFLVVNVFTYMFLITVIKKIYIKKYNEFL